MTVGDYKGKVTTVNVNRLTDFYLTDKLHRSYGRELNWQQGIILKVTPQSTCDAAGPTLTATKTTIERRPTTSQTEPAGDAQGFALVSTIRALIVAIALS